MLRWLSSLTDSRPLGSVAGARKFVASLDRDVFSAADTMCGQLRAFVNDADQQESLSAAALLEVDTRAEPMTTRLERDYLAASLQSHSLRERLWDSGYDWAMRFADAYRAVLMRSSTSVAGRSAVTILDELAGSGGASAAVVQRADATSAARSAPATLAWCWTSDLERARSTATTPRRAGAA